jgi:hypothetical protein
MNLTDVARGVMEAQAWGRMGPLGSMIPGGALLELAAMKSKPGSIAAQAVARPNAAVDRMPAPLQAFIQPQRTALEAIFGPQGVPGAAMSPMTAPPVNNWVVSGPDGKPIRRDMTTGPIPTRRPQPRRPRR